MNEDEVSAFEVYNKRQRSNKKRNDSKVKARGNDPITALRDAARYLNLTNLVKSLEFLRYDNGCINKSKSKYFNLPPQKFNRKSFQNLWDVSLKADDGAIIKAHKCILVARLEYFNCMMNHGWLEVR